MKFLIVDDSIDDVALLRSALKPVEHTEITLLENGHAALQMLSSMKSWPFDLVVIDWRLPGMAGDQLAKAFLSSPVLHPLTPVVVLSSAIPPPLSHNLHECGALVLEKPVDLDGYDRLAAGLCDLARQSKK